MGNAVNNRAVFECAEYEYIQIYTMVGVLLA